MNRILLLEDDISLIDGLEFSLRKSGFEVTVTRTVRDAAEMVSSQTFDLLLLDLKLPDGSGFEICRKARTLSKVPIIFLTASDEEVSVVMGLDMGGDDYITKPFKLNELISRINALLRRAGTVNTEHTRLCSNGFTVKLNENRVLKGEGEIVLTVAEFRLLCLLMQNPGTTLTRDVILDRLWDKEGKYVDNNTLSVYVRRLRSKIEENPENPVYLLTVRGVGYQWNIVK